MIIKKIFKLSLLSFILFLGVWALQAQESKDDFILQILKNEININAELFHKKADPLYLLSYRIDETETYEISSQFGNLMQSDFHKKRLLTIQVRIGESELNNYLFKDINKERLVVLPIENEKEVLQNLIKIETEKAYNEALDEYRKTIVEASFRTGDYHPQKSAIIFENYYEAPNEKRPLDWILWQKKIRSYSMNFNPEAEIITGRAEFLYQKRREYFVSSEGNSVVQNRDLTQLRILAYGQAEDGMELPVTKTWYCFQPEELPADDLILQESIKIKNLLLSLRDAPIADAYSGPVLLSPEVAAQYCQQFITPCLKSSPSGSSFFVKRENRIADSLYSIWVDPTLKYYKDAPLIGGYIFDEEGIRGDKTLLIEKGYSEKQLTTRTPFEGNIQPCGHARALEGFTPSAQPSNLFFSSTQSYSDEELKLKLREVAVRQGKEFGYLLVNFETNPNKESGNTVIAYRIFTDGRPDQLVRGLDWMTTPLSSLSQISASGNNEKVVSDIVETESGNLPISYCVPSLLIQNLDLTAIDNEHLLPPIIKRPFHDDNEFTDFDKIVFKILKEEIKNNLISLHINQLKKAYHFSHLISDAQIMGVSATCGQIIFSYEKPVRKCLTEVQIGNNENNNRNYLPNPKYKMEDEASMTTDNQFSGIRDCIWRTTNTAFQNAEKAYQQKIQFTNNHSHENPILKDQTRMDNREHLALTGNENISLSSIENAVRELSRIFIQYKHIINSRVEAYRFNSSILFLNSEGTKYQQPLTVTFLTVYAESSWDKKSSISDYKTFYFTSESALSDIDKMKSEIIDMIQRLDEKQHAITIQESYIGPVLFIDEAVADLFGAAFIEGRESLLSYRHITEKDGELIEQRNPLNQLIGKRIISTSLSIASNDTLDEFEGTSLIGKYQIDAEGVIPQNNIQLIHNGELKNLLSNRTECENNKESNGHQRFAISEEGVVPSQCAGILTMRGNSTISFKKMEKKLISCAQKEGKEYAYIVIKINSSPYPTLSEDETIASIYRINIKTKETEWVKDAHLSKISIQNFENVEAISTEMGAYNQMISGQSRWEIEGSEEFPLHGVPTSFILPRGIILQNIKIW